MQGQVHTHKDCSWWHYISSNSERHFWRKIRAKGEREKEEGKGKGKLTTVPRHEEKCWGPRVSLLPWVPFPSAAAITPSYFSHSNRVFFISISSNPLQVVPAYSAISTDRKAL